MITPPPHCTAEQLLPHIIQSYHNYYCHNILYTHFYYSASLRLIYFRWWYSFHRIERRVAWWYVSIIWSCFSPYALHQSNIGASHVLRGHNTPIWHCHFFECFIFLSHYCVYYILVISKIKCRYHVISKFLYYYTDRLAHWRIVRCYFAGGLVSTSGLLRHIISSRLLAVFSYTCHAILVHDYYVDYDTFYARVGFVLHLTPDNIDISRHWDCRTR